MSTISEQLEYTERSINKRQLLVKRLEKQLKELTSERRRLIFIKKYIELHGKQSIPIVKDEKPSNRVLKILRIMKDAGPHLERLRQAQPGPATKKRFKEDLAIVVVAMQQVCLGLDEMPEELKEQAASFAADATIQAEKILGSQEMNAVRAELAKFASVNPQKVNL